MRDFNYFSTQMKRGVKIVRNMIIDPLPRKNRLVIENAIFNDNLIEIWYEIKKDRYYVQVLIPDIYASQLRKLDESAKGQLFTLLGLVFSPFFFKLSDIFEIEVKTATLDKESVEFFERFLKKGLGEFRFRQGLNPSRKVKVLASLDSGVTPIEVGSSDDLIMLNGGGKDTIVAAELLKDAELDFTWLSIRPNATRRKVIELSGILSALEVSYKLDPKINVNRIYKWGHFPHTSIVLSIGLMIAILRRARYVAAGNENSANFGNIVYHGMDVNHQYSKSFEFERGLQDFVRRRVVTDVKVFSILRPYGDLQLAWFFSRHKGYFKHFISCNRGIGRGQGEWCKECPKCAFMGLAMFPFVGVEGIEEIFGENILNRPLIRKHIVELVTGSIKPWECVGTKDECRLALRLLLEASPNMDFTERPTRAELVGVAGTDDIEYLRRQVLEKAHDEHLIPAELVSALNSGLVKRQLNGLAIRARSA